MLFEEPNLIKPRRIRIKEMRLPTLAVVAILGVAPFSRGSPCGEQVDGMNARYCLGSVTCNIDDETRVKNNTANFANSALEDGNDAYYLLDLPTDAYLVIDGCGAGRSDYDMTLHLISCVHVG